jgi:membrane protein
VVPADAMEGLRPVILDLASSPGAGLGLVIGLLTAVWTASNYVNAFSRAMNRIYEVAEGRPFWKLRPIMFAITAATLVLLTLGALMLVVSGPVAEALGAAIGLGDAALATWGIVKWPALLAVVAGVVALLYYATPNVEQPRFRWITPGSLTAILTAIGASLLLGLYLSRFASYDETYGTLAGVIVFLLWLWIVNVALLFGAEVNAELERGRQLQAGLPAEDQIQLPPRDTRASDKKAEQEREDFEAARDLRRAAGWEEPPEPAAPQEDAATPRAGLLTRLRHRLHPR